MEVIRQGTNCCQLDSCEGQLQSQQKLHSVHVYHFKTKAHLIRCLLFKISFFQTSQSFLNSRYLMLEQPPWKSSLMLKSSIYVEISVGSSEQVLLDIKLYIQSKYLLFQKTLGLPSLKNIKNIIHCIKEISKY